MKVVWNGSYFLRYVQGWFRFGIRFCLDLVSGCAPRLFEIVVKVDLGVSLGGLSVSFRFTLGLFNVGVMLR